MALFAIHRYKLPLECVLAEQFLDIVGGQSFHKRLRTVESRVDHSPLPILERQDLFLNRAAADQLVGRDDLFLANSVRAVSCLAFHGRIPPWVEVNHCVGARQVEAGAASFQADEEDVGLAGLKSVHLRRAILGLSVKIASRDS